MAGKIDITTDSVLEETEYKRQGSIDDENFLYLINKQKENNDAFIESFNSEMSTLSTFFSNSTFKGVIEDIFTHQDKLSFLQTIDNKLGILNSNMENLIEAIKGLKDE